MKNQNRLREWLHEDVAVVLEWDPAARSRVEVVICYSGLHALWAYRLSHWLLHRRHRLLARTLSQMARFFTGIEIHPGAQIGRRLFIDHGMGVVIGETSVVGNDVTLYQGHPGRHWQRHRQTASFYWQQCSHRCRRKGARQYRDWRELSGGSRFSCPPQCSGELYGRRRSSTYCV
jgi:hypothetical protein